MHLHERDPLLWEEDPSYGSSTCRVCALTWMCTHLHTYMLAVYMQTHLTCIHSYSVYTYTLAPIHTCMIVHLFMYTNLHQYTCILQYVCTVTCIYTCSVYAYILACMSTCSVYSYKFHVYNCIYTYWYAYTLTMCMLTHLYTYAVAHVHTCSVYILECWKVTTYVHVYQIYVQKC